MSAAAQTGRSLTVKTMSPFFKCCGPNDANSGPAGKLCSSATSIPSVASTSLAPSHPRSLGNDNMGCETNPSPIAGSPATIATADPTSGSSCLDQTMGRNSVASIFRIARSSSRANMRVLAGNARPSANTHTGFSTSELALESIRPSAEMIVPRARQRSPSRTWTTLGSINSADRFSLASIGAKGDWSVCGNPACNSSQCL